MNHVDRTLATSVITTRTVNKIVRSGLRFVPNTQAIRCREGSDVSRDGGRTRHWNGKKKRSLFL